MFDEIKQHIAEIQQPRSTFQLQKFVVGQHLTPQMQYYQVVIELQDMINKYELALLNIRKIKIQIERLEKSNDELDHIEAAELRLGLEQTRFAMIGAERELQELLNIYNSFEHKYTRAEIEAAQPDYWKARLTNNAKAMLLGGGLVNGAHIEAMQQADVIEDFMLQVVEYKRELS